MAKNEVLLQRLPRERIDKSKIIALMNNKGGCGKTSTSIAFGMSLVRSGNNVLFWDNDPQSNLTQRMGLPDDKYTDRRLNYLFATAGIEHDHKLIHIVKYPNLYKMSKTVVKPGNIGLMAGSHDAETDANAADQKSKRKTFSQAENKDISEWFRTNIKYYNQYFDYIIMDTAPAMEGNILNKLVCAVVDEIVIPVDGIEAALGMRYLLSWIDSEAKEHNTHRPNATLAMVKYQPDIKADPSARLRNKVFRILKESFGEFVCDNGVRESPTERKMISGFKGSKTDYYALSNELKLKFEQQNRKNIYEHINFEIFNQLESNLVLLQSKIQTKLPQFKTPVFGKITKTIQEIIDTE